jgi:RNA recognition motif-containing protein
MSNCWFSCNPRLKISIQLSKHLGIGNKSKQAQVNVALKLFEEKNLSKISFGKALIFKKVLKHSGKEQWQLHPPSDLDFEKCVKKFQGPKGVKTYAKFGLSFQNLKLEPNLNTFYIANLPHEIDESQLLEFFSLPYWQVHGIQIVRDKKSKKCTGIGFISISSVECVQRIIQILDGRIFLGRPIKVELAKKQMLKKPVQVYYGNYEL